MNLNEKFGWIITEDVIDKQAVGKVGPRSATASREDILFNGQKFRMKDDDGNIYYYGKFLMNQSCSGFEPLDNFGAPFSGCTSIEYLEVNSGLWKSL